ncbi:MAG: DUF2238 domain-containing protein [Phycisphaeraceae bacterium]|nr:DUF2238 domain-containing protein [Phycisphaeraceae bacterium]
MAISGRILCLGVFVVLYMVGFTGYALLRGNSEFVFYALVMVVLIAGTLVVHRRVGFSPLVLWLLAVWGLLHMAGGNVPVPARWAVDWVPPPGKNAVTVLYNFRPVAWMPKYDQIVHAYGFFTATLASFEAIRAAVTGHAGQPISAFRITPGLAVACFLAGMGLGALNEVIEFVATRFMETNVGDYVNTGWDLVCNMIGAALAAGVVFVRGQRQRIIPAR